MPSAERIKVMIRDLIEAALDQPTPSPALSAALNKLLDAYEHRDRLHRA